MSCYNLAKEELEILFKELDLHEKLHVVILRGDLAAGKTTLVKHYLHYRGIHDEATSPTFSVQNCYDENIYHYDIYNQGLDHFLTMGLLEELEKEGIHFIEWGDETLIALLKSVGIDTVVIDIVKNSDTSRCYEVTYA